MYHVYIITSRPNAGRYYIGFSSRPTERLQEHNDGKNPSTASFGPWSLAAIISFPTKQKALVFERYLKTGSGRAFVRRHLL
jgi:putative endonuclease